MMIVDSGLLFWPPCIYVAPGGLGSQK